MDADSDEKTTETLISSQTDSENPPTDRKSRGGGFRGRGRRGHLGHGNMRGGPGMMKAFGPPGHGPMNGFAPLRGMRRMRPYPDMRGHPGRGGPMGMGPPPPPPPMHIRGPFLPMHRHGPPPPPPFGHPVFRGRPPPPRGHGMRPGPPRPFHPCSPRGYHNGPVSPPPHPPPGRGQRWPGPPGGRRF